MGTTAHVLLVAADAHAAQRLLDRAQSRIDSLEQRWSRFITTSELCKLNAAGGRLAIVSDLTFEAVARAVDAWFLTEGRFDPTILPALRAAGYDRTFELIERSGVPNSAADDFGAALSSLAPGCAEIRLHPSVNGITLPVGVELDLGGIGKGLAADLVAEELLAAGAHGALVNIGGDLRCMGTPPWDEGWLVDVDDAFDSNATARRLVLEEGAVVTTTRTRRAWSNDHHHIIDPATGRSASTGLAAVTVVSGEAWWGEVFAKAAFVAGPDAAPGVLVRAGVTGLLTLDDGTTRQVERLEAFAR